MYLYQLIIDTEPKQESEILIQNQYQKSSKFNARIYPTQVYAPVVNAQHPPHNVCVGNDERCHSYQTLQFCL